MASNPVVKGRNKHVKLKWHSIWDFVHKELVELFYIEESKNPADMLTKNLGHVKLDQFRSQLGLVFYDHPQVLRFFFFSCYSPVILTMLTFPSTAQPVHLFLSYLYSFALLSTATRIASLFLFHHSYAFFPSSYTVPLGLCAFSCSINTSSILM